MGESHKNLWGDLFGAYLLKKNAHCNFDKYMLISLIVNQCKYILYM